MAEMSRVRVAVRIRPPDSTAATCIEWDDDAHSVTVKKLVVASDEAPGTPTQGTPSKPKRSAMTPRAKQQGNRYFFDAVHGPESSQTEVFAHARELCNAAIAGRNACVLAYGATGSGKTHTLHGTPAAPGVIALAVEALFDSEAYVAAAPTITMTCVEL